MLNVRTQKNLIKYYELRLDKVKIMHGGLNKEGSLLWLKGKAYIDHAEQALQAVKNGRQW